MLGPSLVFGFILATLCGAVFHLIFGGDARRLALFLIAGWMGFLLGQVLGGALDVQILDIGPLHTLTATIGAWLALFAARLLTGAPNADESTD
jgi:uncharacterized membrane protein YeaQ/YmgE (transglycosylase-associated protein family)